MNDSNSQVSVIIPTFSRAALLKESLNSVLAQTCPPGQIIVVDDGSEDHTQEMLRGFGKRIQVIRQENQGKSTAINRALPLVTGDYVWFFDDDDVALPDAIASRMEVLGEQPELDFVATGHLCGYSCGQEVKMEVKSTAIPPVYGSMEETFLQFVKRHYLHLQGVLAKRALIERTGAFDVRLLRSQDYDYMLRMMIHGKFRVLPSASFILRHHDGPRGPHQVRHNAQNRAGIWSSFDSLIGEKLWETLPLTVYSKDEAATDEQLRTRMQIMASKGFLEGFFADAVTLSTRVDKNSEARQSIAGEIRWIVRKPYFLINLQRARPQDIRQWAGQLAHTSLGRRLLFQMGVGLLRESASRVATPVPRVWAACRGTSLMVRAAGFTLKSLF